MTKNNSISTGICLGNLIIWLTVALVSADWLIYASDALIGQPEVSIFMVSMMIAIISASIIFILLTSKPVLSKGSFLDRNISTLCIGLTILALLFIS